MKQVSFAHVMLLRNIVTSVAGRSYGNSPELGAYLYKPRIFEVLYDARGSGVIEKTKNFT